MKHKDESTQFIKDKIKMLETQTETKLKEFHTDNGGEFVNDELKEYLKQNGTTFTTTTARTPQHNAKAERAGRTMIETIKALLYHCKAPLYLWGEASMCATWVLNHRIAKNEKNRTISQIRTHKETSYKHICTYLAVMFTIIITKTIEMEN